MFISISNERDFILPELTLKRSINFIVQIQSEIGVDFSYAKYFCTQL